ncbi:VOC family protein [Allostreptomyces psammosilenae]|uniref:VOC domain-containing protein n=1 Tax=Allostreptomyces psammosilenae TaxID=1892865 RepID=A0A852ZTK8_9ACTN|nr:VOC family protein [Allostreptomyces psammosilenae]NYI05746.1 hypothetical protein [Allostreptomyces psammosilenae]
MSTKIFVNLPVKDLNKSVEFFTKLGYSFDKRFTDENATSMVISDDIYVMLLVEPFFKTFTQKEVADAKVTTEAIVALTLDSREQVDELLRAAAAAGAQITKEAEEQGPMYGGGFADLDGHLWEAFHMDASALEG